MTVPFGTVNILRAIELPRALTTLTLILATKTQFFVVWLTLVFKS